MEETYRGGEFYKSYRYYKGPLFISVRNIVRRARAKKEKHIGSYFLKDHKGSYFRCLISGNKRLKKENKEGSKEGERRRGKTFFLRLIMIGRGGKTAYAIAKEL